MPKKIYIGALAQQSQGVNIQGVNITDTNVTQYFNVSNGSYYFLPSGSNFTSTNKTHSTTSTTTLTARQDIANISFDYSVSSESNYDKLTVEVNGTKVANAISGTVSNSYTGGPLLQGQTLKMTYSKDGSVSRGNDEGIVSNIVIKIQSNEVSEVAHEVKKVYVGINNKARKVKKIYLGVNNIAKEVFSASSGG